MIYIIMIALIAIDQLSKYVTVEFLIESDSIPLIPKILQLTYVENRGAAFGIMQNKQYIFITITILAILFGVVYYERSIKKEEIKLYKIIYILIVSGAIGNLIDRVFRGFVVDMIDFHLIDYPVFNIADSYIVVGCILLGITILMQDQKKMVG